MNAHQKQTNQSQAAARNYNYVYNGQIVSVDWLAVKVVPDYKRNSHKIEKGFWLVIDEERKVLAEGTKAYCDSYVQDSKKKYGEMCDVELETRIGELLDAAEKSAQIYFEESLKEQQARINEVHALTGKAIVLASWISESFAATVKDLVSSIRKHANLIYCGQELWNIKIFAETENAIVDMMISHAVKIVTAEVNKEKGTPKFMTHQVLCDGKMIAAGRQQACLKFVEISREVIRGIEEERKLREKETKFGVEKAQARRSILCMLSEAKRRLEKGEPFIGEIQSLVEEASNLASCYGLDSSKIREFCSDAVFSVAEPAY